MIVDPGMGSGVWLPEFDPYAPLRRIYAAQQSAAAKAAAARTAALVQQRQRLLAAAAQQRQAANAAKAGQVRELQARAVALKAAASAPKTA